MSSLLRGTASADFSPLTTCTHIQVEWLEAIAWFNDILQKLKAFLKQAGFKVAI